jgi:hypothetical protein
MFKDDNNSSGNRIFTQSAQQDFSHAYMKSFLHAMRSWIQRESNDLLPYDEVRKHIPMRGQHYIGLQQIETQKIIGSVSRFNDFDRAFLPRQTHTRSRWESIDRAYFADVILPPIDVYKVGDVYFVKDGNHRVSVARERGQAYMDAYVIEIDIPGTLDASANLDNLIMVQEYAEFLNTTHLDEFYPGQDFHFSIPGQYEKILQHISVHQWFMGEAQKHPIEYLNAVKGWYKDLYWPLIKIIRKHDILKKFPNRTETDLYLWIIEHRWYLGEELHRSVSLEAAALHFAQRIPQGPFRHVRQWFKWVIKKFENKERIK